MGELALGEKNTYQTINSPNWREVTIISKVNEQKGGLTRKEVYPNLFTRSEEGMRNHSMLMQAEILFSDGSLNSGEGLRHVASRFRTTQEELAS